MRNIFIIFTFLFVNSAFAAVVSGKKVVVTQVSAVETGEVIKVKKNVKKVMNAKISREYIENAIVEAAEKAQVPVQLLRAICTVESDLNPHSFVLNDGGDNNHALGLCQVLRKTAEFHMGRAYSKCARDFSKGTGLERSYENCELFGPKVNAYVAAIVLKEKLVRYKGDVVIATAAYNAGSLKYCGPSGWLTTVSGKKIHKCKKGDLLNRYYINRVDAALAPHTFESLNEQLLCKN